MFTLLRVEDVPLGWYSEGVDVILWDKVLESVIGLWNLSWIRILVLIVGHCVMNCRLKVFGCFSGGPTTGYMTWLSCREVLTKLMLLVPGPGRCLERTLG